MLGIDTIQWGEWACSVLLQFCLLAILLYRRNHRFFPVFTFYLTAAVLQSILQLAIYNVWGYNSERTVDTSWALQGLVTVFRVLAVLELCYVVFHYYSGIWMLISRALGVLFAVVVCGALLFVGRNTGLRILNADRALGLALATSVVGLFLFARYYQVRTREPVPAMAVGFFLYSCFVMVNDTILEIWLRGYVGLWNFLGVLAFIGSVLVWGWALRHPIQQPESAPQMLPASVYEAFSPEVNVRLRLLNERLSQLGKPPMGKR